MGFLDKILGKRLEPKLFQIMYRWLGFNSAIFMNDNKEELIRKGYMFNPDVYAVINLIVKAASGIPFELYDIKDKKAFSRYSAYKNRNIHSVKSEMYRIKGLEQVEEHPILNLMRNPNPLQGEVEFTENVLAYKLLTGNSYINILSPKAGINAGLVQEMYVLPAHLTEILSSGNMYNPIGGYQLIVGDRSIKFDPKEVIHLKYFNPDWQVTGTHLYGQSPLKAFSRVIQVSNDNYTANAKILQNMGAVGILSGDGDSELNEEQVDKLNQRWQENYSGADRMGRVVLTSSKLSWQKMGMSVTELGLFESKMYNLRDICNAFNVSSKLLNDPENTTYNNMAEARKSLYVDVVIPLLDSYVAELNRTIVAQYNKKNNTNLVLGYDSNAVPELQEDLSKVRETIKDLWILTPNEQREVMGFDRSKDKQMDYNWIPSNLIPMQMDDIDLGAVGETINRMDVEDKED